jgi:hypothetical protein
MKVWRAVVDDQDLTTLSGYELGTYGDGLWTRFVREVRIDG